MLNKQEVQKIEMAAKTGLFGYRAKILSYCGDKHKSGD